jgi:predicted nucleic acid-binding protein
VRFQDRVISLDVPILLRWDQLVADLESKGRRMPAIDSLLAATAAETGFTLATRNEVHFQSVSVDVINPWPNDPH